MRIAAAFLALCAACGDVHYVETRPPQLRKASASWTATQGTEPIVFLTLLDLYLEAPLDCAAARAWTKARVAEAMNAAGAPWTQELPSQDLSPACDQSARRAVDVASATQQLLAAIAAHPEANVRGIVVYVNNLDLPVGDGLRAGILGVRAQMAVHGKLSPLTWLIGAPAPRASLDPDFAVRWSYSGDAALADAIRAMAAAELPLTTDAQVDSGPLPLVAAGDPAQAVKVCKHDTAIAAPAEDGVALPVGGESSPTFAAHFQRRIAGRKSRMPPLQATVEVELCDANCDRYYDYQPGIAAKPWRDSAACALEAP